MSAGLERALAGTAAAGLFALALSGAALAAPNVVATIKPIHALVAAVMDGIATPTLIVKGGASPHTYSLRPSDAQALENADIVFWSGHGMEVFLEDLIDTLAPAAESLALSQTPGLVLLPVREGGAFEPHEHGGEADHAHEHDHAHDDHAHDDHAHDDHAHDDHAHEHDGHGEADDHAHGEIDMHFWLDPVNAERLVGAIAEALAASDPENAAAYAENAAATQARLHALGDEITLILAPVRGRPFIVFHDAYQYFERRFGLTVAGSITVSPETMPGARRVAALHQKLADLDAACIFAEPQFEPAVVATIAEGTGARIGTLDPEGAGLAEGPGLYAELLRGLARSISDCLSE